MKAKDRSSFAGVSKLFHHTPSAAKESAVYVQILRQNKRAKVTISQPNKGADTDMSRVMNSATKATQLRPKIASFVAKNHVVTVESIVKRQQDRGVRAEIPFDLIERN